MSLDSYRLRYGHGEVTLDLRGFDLLDVVRPTAMPALPPGDARIDHLLAAPTHGSSLHHQARHARRITLICPDHTRGRTLADDLTRLVKVLLRAGRSAHDLTLLVATGVHRPASASELTEVLGEAGRLVGRVLQNSPPDASAMQTGGRTSRGTSIRLQRAVFEADLLLLTGSIGFHYFAGFTGGRKAVLPGVAAPETILANHRLALDLSAADGLHPLARIGNLDGNPVHEDMLEALQGVAPAFLFNRLEIPPATDEAAHEQATGTLSPEATGIVTGDPLRAHETACRIVGRALGRSLAQQADLAVVSAGGHPRDLNFIQAHKALEHCYRAAREGGTILLLAECSDGLASEQLLPWLAHESVAQMKAVLRHDYTLHAHTALALRRKTSTRRVVCLSALDADLVRRLGMIPAATPAEAMHLARAGLPAGAALILLPHGHKTAVVGTGATG